MPTCFKGEPTKMWEKDKEACFKEGESNPRDSKGHSEMVAIMEKELKLGS